MMPAHPSPKELVHLANDLIDDQFFGILTTVDDHGRPHARWMGAATIDAVHTLLTLSTRGSRKCQHLATNPNVCWLFSSPDQGDVVTLLGRAQVSDAPGITQRVWDRLVPCARRYAMDVLGQQHEPDYCVVETWVQQVELLSPRLGLVTPRIVTLPEPGSRSPVEQATDHASQQATGRSQTGDDTDEGAPR